ncbi:MAG TPA: hypothetical protein VG944_06340 [Fimbriimonas sp.]|nr:hypothetical protein [Fimbriimonas sp.]
MSGLVLQKQPAITTDPAFLVLKQLVGGKWRGKTANGLKVEFRFNLEQNGTLLVGKGGVALDTKHPFPMRSSIGWDPAAKKLYYLDQHGNDTVYFGHVTKEGDQLVWDFKGLSGDQGHYKSLQKMTQNEYSSTMRAEKDGKWVDLGFHLALHRVR